MSLQKVNHISYLSVVPIDLSQVVKPADVDICILPEGAQIMEVSIEVVIPGLGGSKGTLTIDSKEFIKDADLSQTKSYKSSVITGLNKAGVLKGNFSQNKGELVVRVHYFLPSQILAEYAD